MTSYNEQEGLAFQQDVQRQYAQAGQALDLSNVVWSNRMTYDAVSMGYAAARTKHLHALWVALGSVKPEPPAPAPIPQPPPDIKTTDIEQVRLRVRYWLGVYGHLTPADEQMWMDYIFDKAGEGHDIGWTADDYWREKMRIGYGQ